MAMWWHARLRGSWQVPTIMTWSPLQEALHMQPNPFLTMGPSFRLASSFPWRGALQGWDHTKVDAVQWLQHILPRAAAPTMRGRWEARASLQGACACTHAADTWSPLYLQADIGAGASDLDLTALFSEWRFQDDRCALVQAPQLLCVAFPRWLNSAEGERRLLHKAKRRPQFMYHASVRRVIQHTPFHTTSCL